MLPQQSKQKMFRAYVVVVEVPSFLNCVLDDFLRSRRLRQLAHGDHVRATLDKLFDFEANFAEVDVEVFEYVSADAAPFFDQSQEYVFRPDVLVIEALGLLIRQRHHLSGPVRESFKHVHLLLADGIKRRPLLAVYAVASRALRGHVAADSITSLTVIKETGVGAHG